MNNNVTKYPPKSNIKNKDTKRKENLDSRRRDLNIMGRECIDG
jgi:hypothetical protein